MGYTVYKVEHIDTHGGSIRVYVGRTHKNIDSSVEQFLVEEDTFGLKSFSTYLNFAKRIEEAKRNTLANLQNLKDQGITIVGYGSPAKATTVLNYYGITSDSISYLVEDNSLKHNKIVPGVRIPIVSKDRLGDGVPKIVLVMAWNFYEEIKRKNENYINEGIQFINIKELAETKIPQ